MANSTDSTSEEFHKGTEDLQKLADEVERAREARASQQTGYETANDTETDGDTEIDDDTQADDDDDTLDAPEEDRDVPMGSINRVTHEGGHRI